MTEKHKRGPDGLLNDGVRTYAATQADLAMYQQANHAMRQMHVPTLFTQADRHARIFIALFDGTANDAINDAAHATNIGAFSEQLKSAQRHQPSIFSHYVAGPGTQERFLPALRDQITGHTYSARLEDMYQELIRKTEEWREAAPHADIRVIAVGFSRGAEQAAGFTRLVHERGIQDQKGQVEARDAQGRLHVAYTRHPLVLPGQVPMAVSLFDPVGTGQPLRHDRRLPPSVLSGLQIISRDERRNAFPSSRVIAEGLSADGRFLGVLVPGAHSDVGGGYHRNGLSVRSGNLMVDFINAHSSTPLLHKQPEPADPRLNVIHRSEDHQSLGPVKLHRTSGFRADGLRDERRPAPLCRTVEDCGPPEPMDARLAALFERRPVQIAPVDIIPAPLREEVLAEQRDITPQALEPGDRGAEVAALQTALIQLGINERLYQPLEVTGHYDQNTRHAVLAFQLQHGTPEISGVADAQTLQQVHAKAFELTQPTFEVGAPQAALPAEPNHRRVAEGHDRVAAFEQQIPHARASIPTHYEHLHDIAPRRHDHTPIAHDVAATSSVPAQSFAANIPSPPPSPSPGSLPYSDPRHAEHPLYADANERLQAQGHAFNEDRLNQITAHLHNAGFKAGWEGQMWVSADKVHTVDDHNLWNGRMHLPLTDPAPPTQDSMDKAQQHDAFIADIRQHGQQQNHAAVMG